MEKILRVDGFVGRHMPWFILSCVVLGVSFPGVFAPLRNSYMPLMAISTFINSLGGGFRDLGVALKKPAPILIAFVMLHAVLPMVVMGIGTVVFPNDPEFVSGLVLQFTLPVGVTSLLWVGMSGGHVSLCLSMVLLDTLLAPFSIPLALRLLLGSVVEMDTAGMMKDLLLMVCIPALLAMFVYEKTDGRVARTVKPKLAPAAKLVLFLMIAITGSNCSDFFLNINRWLIIVVITVLSLSVMGFLLGYLVTSCLKMDFPAGFTLAVIIGFRNISAGIVLAQQYFPAPALLPVAIMPLFQQLLVSVVIKILWNTKGGREYAAALEAAKSN